MFELSLQYEQAAAAEHAAFEALLNASPDSPEYPKLFERWQAAIAAADRARKLMSAAFGLASSRPEHPSGPH